MRKKPKKGRVGWLARRNQALHDLGFASYPEYLASDLWRGIRASVLAISDVCVLCDCPAQHVHHVGYGRDVLAGRTLRPLKPLCAACHRFVEFDGARKRRLSEAQAVFQAILDRLADPAGYEGLTNAEYLERKSAEKRARRLGYKNKNKLRRRQRLTHASPPPESAGPGP